MTDADTIPWWHGAACREVGSEPWDPKSTDQMYATRDTAKRICIEHCNVRLDCGIDAMAYSEEATIRAGFSLSAALGRKRLAEWLAAQGIDADAIDRKAWTPVE